MILIGGKEVCVNGGLLKVGALRAEQFDFVDDPKTALDELRQSGTPIDLFTFVQRVSDTLPRYPYPIEWDNFAGMPISTYENWWSKQIDSKTRNMVRRAEKKGVEVREVAFDATLIHGIWKIYNEYPVRQGRRFVHYGKDFDTVQQEAATFLDRSMLLGAFHNGELIGFAKLTCDDTRAQASVMNIITMIQYRDKAPANALVAQAVRSCAQRDIPYFVYSRFAYGSKGVDGLAEFKRNNGFQQIDVPRYYIPLTPFGAIAFRLGLHKKLTDRLPRSVVTSLRDLRNAWYKRSLGVSDHETGR